MSTTTSWQLQSAVIGELFLCYCMFWVTEMFYFLKWGHETKEVYQTKKPIPAPAADQSEGIFKRWDNYQWRRDWTSNLAIHMVSLGLPLMYSPFIYSVVVSWLFFGVCVAIVVLHLLQKLPKVISALWALGKCFNILLIIGGLAGAGNAFIIPR